MTNLVTVKKPTAIQLKGVTLDWVIEDGAATRLTITDKRGASLVIAKSDNYSKTLNIMQPKPAETAEMHALTGKVSGVKIKEVFPTEYDAKKAVDTLTNFGSVENTLEIKPVTVPVDDDGNADADDFPF